MAEKKSTTRKPAPKKRAAKKVEELHQLNPKPEDIARAHAALIGEYINALNQVSKLRSWLIYVELMDINPALEILGTTERRRKYVKILKDVLIPAFRLLRFPTYRFPTLSYLIRLFVESHIKGKLNELSISYLYLLQTVPEKHPSAENYRTWLKDTSETCDKLSGTLSSLQSTKGLASTLWPIVVNVAAALLGVSTLKELFTNFSWANLLPWITFIAFPFIYFGIFMTGAFWYKRELFTGITLLESIMQPFFKWTQDSANNVYQLEDHVFNLLGRGKNHEFRWDLITIPLSLFSFIPIGLSEWIQDPSKPVDWVFLGVILLAIIGSISIISLRKWD